MGTCVSCTKNKSDSSNTSIKDSEHALLDRIGSAQIEMLRSKFNQHENQGGIDISGFKKIMPYISKLPNDQIECAFNIFRAHSKERITWTTFCATVSQYILGTRKEKCRFLYDVFDKKKKGFLGRDDINMLNRHLLNMLNTNSNTQVNKTEFLTVCSKVAFVVKFEVFCEWAITNIDLHKALQPFEIIPSPITEKEIYLKYQTELKNKKLVNGECYYLISLEWLSAWKRYVRLNSDEEEIIESSVNMRYRSTSFKSGARPIEIRNIDILDQESKVRLLPGMKEGTNFEVLSKDAWSDFVKWYGGGPEIIREAIEENGNVFLETYPKILKIIVKKPGSSVKDPVFQLLSRNKTVKSVADRLKMKLSLEGDYRLVLKGKEIIELDYGQSFKDYQLEELNFCTFELAQSEYSFLQEETQKFNLEDMVEYFDNGYWTSATIKQITNTEYVLGANWHKKQIKISRAEAHLIRKPLMTAILIKTIPFSTGLMNIGNTCYMNSIIQCIAHSPLINQYFSGQDYVDLKRRSRLNTKFKIIEEVENLLSELRNTQDLAIRPDRFYVEFTKIHKQFQGFEQHDTHEFLSILLDSLHEDLRLSISLLSHTTTLKGISFEEERKVSQDQWDKYRGHSGSVISQICGGQTRNSLVCKNCTEKSTIFEVFNDFSIPIPIKQYDTEFTVSLVKLKAKESLKVLIKVNRNDSLDIFYETIEKKCGIDSVNLLFAFAKNGFFFKLFSPNSIEELLEEDEDEEISLYAFEVINSVEDCEGLGKTTLKREKPEDWREKLKTQDMVDIRYNKKWEVGIIKNIAYKENILISIQKVDTDVVLHPVNSPEVKFYRSRTKSSNTILKIPLFHAKFSSKSIKFLGFPQVVSIGSWYSFKDLHKAIIQKCLDFSNRTKSLKKKLKFHMYKDNKICWKCENKRCRECHLPKTLQLLEDFKDETFFLVADWSEGLSFNECFLEDPDETEVCLIQECFSKYTELEEIEVKCENCGNNNQDSQIEIWRLPDLLIIHLKRFSFSNSRFMKISHLVKFPLVGLDLSFWMLNSKKKKGNTIKTSRENNLYDLYAVVNHSGGITGGHYTNFCKLDDGRWLYFDDDKAFQVTGELEEQIVTKKAYILFYKRQRFRSSNVVKTMSLGK